MVQTSVDFDTRLNIMKKTKSSVKEKPVAGKTDYRRGFYRSGWDSNPRNLAVQLISSQSRYDHFDTAPYLSKHQHLEKLKAIPLYLYELFVSNKIPNLIFAYFFYSFIFFNIFSFALLILFHGL